MIWSIALFVLLLFTLVVYRFGGGLVQEANPIPIIISALLLDFSDDEYKHFSTTKDYERYIAKAGDQGKIITELMKDNGWAFDEQLGSVYIFHKDGETAGVGTESYSEHYKIWDVPKEVFN